MSRQKRKRSAIGRILGWSAAVAGALTIAVAAGAWLLYSQAATETVGELGFENALHVPPLLEPETDENGVKSFDLTAREGEAELLPGRPAETWGFNGAYFGPTLRASRGEQVRVRVRNELPETTTVHWHGMHLPAAADGGPHQTIEPGAEWTSSWTVDQPAATLWYHPHMMGTTEDHVYRGLAGMFILDDEDAESLELPDDYGVNDFPLIVQDKRLADGGELEFSQGIVSPIGRLGEELLVNGTHDPHLEVEHQRIRLRLLNASTARSYDFGFADSREFEMIATEGGLLPRPERLERIQLSPGERAEIVVELDPGERAVLRSFEPDLGEVDFFNRRFVGGDDSFDVLELRAADELAAAPEVPAELARLEPPREAGVDIRRFELGSRSINGREMDMERIDEVVTLGSSEVWEVENRAGIPHNFHVHDVRFRVLEIGGEPPPAELAGLKDTVFVPPGETARLLIDFGDYADPELPYMFHCHLLEHEDRGMMGQFVVVEPGESPGSPPQSEHEHPGGAPTHADR